MAKCKLTISMLVCGRDTTIRCLDSLVPILEGLDSELILVDTGCPAELRAQLTKYTDQIIPFTWCDDFAAARNVGMKAAHGEWFLYIDDDEWFENPEALIQFFKSGQYRKYGCVNYIQRNYYDADFIHYDDFWASRMIKLDADTCFHSKIHEYMAPIRGEAFNLELIANHTGYIFQTPEAKRKHFDRNAPLLLEMIKEEPERLRWRVQLMQEYRSIKDYQEMYRFGEESLAFTEDRNNERDNWDIGTFYAGAAEGKFFLGEFEDSLQMAERGLKDPRMNEMCHAYMYLCKATVYFDMGKWSEAEDSIHRYFKIKKALSKNKIRFANQKSSLLVGEAFDVFPQQRAYSILCACELKRKDAGKLKKYVAQMGWDKNRVYLFDGFLKAVAEAMATLPTTKEFIEVAQLAWNNPVVQPKFFIEIQAWEEKDQKKYERLLRIVAQLEGSQWYLHYARILVADMDGNAEILPEEFQKFLQSTSNIFLTPENISAIMNKHGIATEPYYLAIPYDKWCKDLIRYLSNAEYSDMILKKLEFETMRTEQNVRYAYFDTCMAEVEVLHSVGQGYDKKREALQFFADKATSFLDKYYKQEIIEEELELLPIYGQVAFRVRDALALEATDMKRALEIYREIVVVNPEWADVMKSYMNALGEEVVRKEDAAKEEMERLEQGVLEEVHKLVHKKQYEDALSVLKQLKQMKPNDLDLAELTLRIRLTMIENA